MAYNTKTIVRDAQSVPAPQLFNATSDAYEVVQGKNGAMRTMVYDSNGNPVFTGTNPGSVTITSIPEVEVKNDSGNPLSADVTDRSARVLGKITADDSALAQIGAMAATAVTNPASSASVIALLKGLIAQLQGSGSGRQPVITQNSSGTEIMTSSNPGIIKDQTQLLITSPVTRTITLTETPVALNSKSNLRQITVKNLDQSITVKIGETGMTPANAKGMTLDPGAIYQESFDPATSVTVYGSSTGAAITVGVYEA